MANPLESLYNIKETFATVDDLHMWATIEFGGYDSYFAEKVAHKIYYVEERPSDDISVEECFCGYFKVA